MESAVAVSVIIPVYNGAKYIEDSVKSILKEDFNSFEILLIDDGSKDNSYELCKNLAKLDDRVKVHTKENGGICDARNFALNLAKGEYIAFADHDDTVYSGFLKENYEYARKTNADIVKFGRDSYVVTPLSSKLDNTRKFTEKLLGKDDIKKRFLKLYYNYSLNCVWDALFKRDLIESKSIRFNTDYKTGGEDIDFCSKCFAAAEKVAFSNKVYYKHIIRTGFSTSARQDLHKLTAFKLLADNIDECIDKLCIERKNNNLYSTLIVRDFIYPSISFLMDIGYKSSQVKKYIKNEFSHYKKYMPSFITLLKVRNKWATMGFLFKHNMYKTISLLYKYKGK